MSGKKSFYIYTGFVYSFIFWQVIIVRLQKLLEIKFIHVNHSIITSLDVCVFPQD
jgi:mRNA degradation ribonuclease J1/J2